jgi:hypothetical protein
MTNRKYWAKWSRIGIRIDTQTTGPRFLISCGCGVDASTAPDAGWRRAPSGLARDNVVERPQSGISGECQSRFSRCRFGLRWPRAGYVVHDGTGERADGASRSAPSRSRSRSLKLDVHDAAGAWMSRRARCNSTADQGQSHTRRMNSDPAGPLNCRIQEKRYPRAYAGLI